MPADAPPRHLLHVFPSFGIGGPEVRFTKVANRLGPKYRHTIVAMDGDFTCAGRLDPALRVDLVTVPARKGRALDPGNLMRFARVLHERRPDALITQNWGAVEWALAHRLWPVGHHLHFEDGFGPEEADGRQLPRRVWLRRLALGRRTRVIVPSRTLERIARDQWRLAPPSVVYVPNGVDCARFHPGAPRDPALAALRAG
ncbi:MAG TPA: glycosyltransferase, partial [Azospirillum sp.]